MAHSRSRRRRPYRLLRAETPSTVAVLTTAQDFDAMRGYRTFTFDDYAAYLAHVQTLLRSLDGQGVHARVAPFDPDRFADFCACGRIEPDASASRTRYTAEVASHGPCLTYEGQDCDRLLPLLRTWRTRDTSWREAARILGEHRAAPGVSGLTEESALLTAGLALEALLAALGPGTHHMVCSVAGPGTPLVAALQAEGGVTGRYGDDEPAVPLFRAVLAAGLAAASPGGLVTRTTPPRRGGVGRPETVRGWCLHGGWLAPLTEGQVFSAYCTHAETGEPIPPEPDVEYAAGLPLPRPAPRPD